MFGQMSRQDFNAKDEKQEKKFKKILRFFHWEVIKNPLIRENEVIIYEIVI